MSNVIAKLVELYNSPIYPAVITLLFVLSEYIGESDRFKSSSLLGFIKNILKMAKDKIPPQQ